MTREKTDDTGENRGYKLEKDVKQHVSI